MCCLLQDGADIVRWGQKRTPENKGSGFSSNLFKISLLMKLYLHGISSFKMAFQTLAVLKTPAWIKIGLQMFCTPLCLFLHPPPLRILDHKSGGRICMFSLCPSSRNLHVYIHILFVDADFCIQKHCSSSVH